MKISNIQNPIYYKPINFKAIRKNYEYESSDATKLGFLCHTSSFFRYKDLDEFVCKYIKDNYQNKSEINILSLGCSSGEEVYSHAIMLDDLNPKPSILGFDPSQRMIDMARIGKYELGYEEKEFLFKSNYAMSPFWQDTADKFSDYFDLQTIFSSSNLSDSSFIKNSIFRCKKSDDTMFSNCSFDVATTDNFDSKIDNESMDVILFRNVIYHVLDTDNYKIDASTCFDIAKKLYKSLKPGGIVVFAPYEIYDYIKYGFQAAGFTNLKNDRNQDIPCVWKKPLIKRIYV